MDYIKSHPGVFFFDVFIYQFIMLTLIPYSLIDERLYFNLE